MRSLAHSQPGVSGENDGGEWCQEQATPAPRLAKDMPKVLERGELIGVSRKCLVDLGDTVG